MLRVAIIGMGKMGRIRLKHIEEHGGFELVAVCDIAPSVESEFQKYRFFTEWEKVLELDLDAVFVCTYNHVSPVITCKALEKGLHVFCEKPPGRDIDDVLSIIEAEKKNPKIVKFGFNHRFHYAVMEAKAIVDSGKLGQILWARGIYGKAGDLNFEQSWRSNKELAGGGILLDQGIHMLDLLRYFMGDFVDVKSFVENCYWQNISMEDNAFALLRTADNKVAMLHSSATHWKHKFALDLFFENGYLSLNGILSSTRSYGDESITFAKKQFEDESKAFGRPREETIYFDKDDSWKFEIDEFFNNITGKEQRISGSTQDALKVMQLIEAIYENGR